MDSADQGGEWRELATIPQQWSKECLLQFSPSKYIGHNMIRRKTWELEAITEEKTWECLYLVT
jgi:hypothetical protein